MPQIFVDRGPVSPSAALEDSRDAGTVAVDRSPTDAAARKQMVALAHGKELAYNGPEMPQVHHSADEDEVDWRERSTEEPALRNRIGNLRYQISNELAYRSWVFRLWARDLVRDPVRLSRFVAALLLLVWCLIASLLLVAAKLTYEGSSVENARARYAAVCAERAGAEAAGIFGAALSVYDAVNYAVQRKLYFEPLDYGMVKQILSPLFAAHGALRAVDLAFMGRNFSFSARRRWRTNTTHPNHSEPILLLQSNFSDCFDRLGETGCLSAVPGRDQPWFTVGSALPAGQESESIGRAGYTSVKRSALGSAFRWLDGPRIVPRDQNTSVFAGGRIRPEGDLVQAAVTWEPGYSLVFRSTFPGTSASLSVVGRATVRVDGLAEGGVLSDATWLGASGAICIVDRHGVLVAAASSGDLLFVQAGTGRVRFRRLWELDAAWARSMQGHDFSASGLQHLDAENFHIVVAPLPGRGMEQFRAVVAAEREAFVDLEMTSQLGRGMTVIALPYPAAVMVLLVWWGFLQYKRRKALKRIRPASPEDYESEVGGRSAMYATFAQRAQRAQHKGPARRGAGGSSAALSMVGKRGAAIG
mmetsp:Transcript_95616/g.308524  ORF Transcript_95616/g.308524 Transcript_95616/m.308524 type:complete len:587 (+) Transcript_95616:101-1861(+)